MKIIGIQNFSNVNKFNLQNSDKKYFKNSSLSDKPINDTFEKVSFGQNPKTATRIMKNVYDHGCSITGLNDANETLFNIAKEEHDGKIIFELFKAIGKIKPFKLEMNKQNYSTEYTIIPNLRKEYDKYIVLICPNKENIQYITKIPGEDKSDETIQRFCYNIDRTGEELFVTRPFADINEKIYKRATQSLTMDDKGKIRVKNKNNKLTLTYNPKTDKVTKERGAYVFFTERKALSELYYNDLKTAKLALVQMMDKINLANKLIEENLEKLSTKTS